MTSSIDRMDFPQGYVLRPDRGPCTLDSLVALDANLRPLDGLAPDVFPIGCTTHFVGWAVASTIGGYTLPTMVRLAVDGTHVSVRATLGLAREDVANDLGDRRLRGAGFRGTGTIPHGATPGRYSLSLVVFNADRTYLRNPLPKIIEIADSRLLFPSVPESNRTEIGLATVEAMHGGTRREGARFTHGEILVARGEAADRASERPASRVFAIVDGASYHPGIAGLASERGNRNGFTVRIPTDYLEFGKHTLRLAAIATDGTSYTCVEETSFTLRRA